MVDGRPAGDSSCWSRLVAALAGRPAARLLAVTHASDDFADALITLSFVGSLFFSVSFEASRGRILLYLLLTVAPLAFIAPVVGPMLDRIGVGYRLIIIASHVARAVFAALLTSSLLSLAFYPLVFGILLARKAYDLAKTAMFAQLLPDRADLVAVSGHLARTGTIVGGIGTAVGGSADRCGRRRVASSGGSGRLPGRRRARHPHPGHRGQSRGRRSRDSSRDADRGAPSDDGSRSHSRAAAGALTFLLALSIKRGGSDEWIFVAALVAAGVGAFGARCCQPGSTGCSRPTAS